MNKVIRPADRDSSICIDGELELWGHLGLKKKGVTVGSQHQGLVTTSGSGFLSRPLVILDKVT